MIASIFGLACLRYRKKRLRFPDVKPQAILRLAEEVRKQIVKKPQGGVFDSFHCVSKALRSFCAAPLLVLEGKALHGDLRWGALSYSS